MQLSCVFPRLFYAFETFLESLGRPFMLVIRYLLLHLGNVSWIVFYLVDSVSDRCTHLMVCLPGNQLAQIAVNCFESGFGQDRRIVVSPFWESSRERCFLDSLNFFR